MDFTLRLRNISFLFVAFECWLKLGQDIGRLMLREDGSGAIEYYYDKMGEVFKTVRTLIMPNQAVATYITQWKYDSHNRLLEMIYPDEEKVTYGCNLGGQVDHVRGY